MFKETVDSLIEASNELGVLLETNNNHHSTFGVVGSHADFVGSVALAARSITQLELESESEDDFTNFIEDIRTVRIDNLGDNMLFY